MYPKLVILCGPILGNKTISLKTTVCLVRSLKAMWFISVLSVNVAGLAHVFTHNRPAGHPLSISHPNLPSALSRDIPVSFPDFLLPDLFHWSTMALSESSSPWDSGLMLKWEWFVPLKLNDTFKNKWDNVGKASQCLKHNKYLINASYHHHHHHHHPPPPRQLAQSKEQGNIAGW